MILPMLLLVSTVLTKSPVIGILTKPFKEEYNIPLNYTYVIESQYVRFLTQAGARVVPIRHDLSSDQLKALLDQLDGAFFPGGGSEIRTFDQNNVPNGYTALGATGKAIVDYSFEESKNNGYFPVWGTCLGFEMIGLAVSNNLQILSTCPNKDCSSMNAAVHFESYPGNLVESLSDSIQYAMETENFTANNHEWMISVNDFMNSNLTTVMHIGGTSYSISGKYSFVSIFEGTYVPIYGVQFHPCLHNLKIWEHAKFVVHNITSIQMSEQMATFFVNDCAKSKRSMNDSTYNLMSIYIARSFYSSDNYQLYIMN